MRSRSLRKRISARDVAAAGTGRNGVALVFERLVVKEPGPALPVRVPWNAFPDVIVLYPFTNSNVYRPTIRPSGATTKRRPKFRTLLSKRRTSQPWIASFQSSRLMAGDTTGFQWHLVQFWPSASGPARTTAVRDPKHNKGEHERALSNLSTGRAFSAAALAGRTPNPALMGHERNACSRPCTIIETLCVL